MGRVIIGNVEWECSDRRNEVVWGPRDATGRNFIKQKTIFFFKRRNATTGIEPWPYKPHTNETKQGDH